MDYYRKHQLWFWTYLQNWVIIFRDDSKAISLNHYWSLAIEEQFYLLWPFIVLILKRPVRIFFLSFSILVMVIATRYYIWQHRELFPSYERTFLFTRIDGILTGAMLAAICKISLSLFRKYFTAFILILTAVNYLFYVYKKNQSPDFPVWAIAGFTTFAFLFTIIVYEAVLKENRFINYLLTIRVLRLLGKYSYGFYIFHWPVAILTRPLFTDFSNSLLKNGSMAQQFLAGVLISFAGLIVSIISYHFFERHFLKLKMYFE